jgi:multicomponent Na+:H+ antiporter subunit F
MAAVSVWLAAVIALLPPLAAPVWIGLTGRTADRLAAAQLANAVTGLTIVLMSFAFDLPSIVDLALTLAFLGLPGSLLLAQFFERWL